MPSPLPPNDPPPARVGVVSLGCPKNLVDTEVLLGRLAADHMICADPADADVVVVNTCCFIDEAREESLEAIEEVARLKDAGVIRGVVVTGCLAQRWGERLQQELPQIDAVVGMASYGQIGAVLQEVLAEPGSRTRALVAADPTFPLSEQTGRLRVTPPHYAYLQLSEGCDNACTFCSIPLYRGRFRSKPRSMILAEARELIEAGAIELNLISQDTTAWGVDLGEEGLASLLRDLAALNGVHWIRVLYAYPGRVDDDLLAALRDLQPVVVPYLDLPIQHIVTRVLKRMGRRHTREGTYALLERLRAEVPDLVLRTTLLCGFPGTTEDDFQQLTELVRTFRFERLGAFAYSHEPGTAAHEHFDDDVSPEEKQDRLEQLMLEQQGVAFAHAEAQVGRTLEVLVDGLDEEGSLVGRTAHDAPEIDPHVVLAGETSAGAVVRARITGASGYDLEGDILEV